MCGLVGVAGDVGPRTKKVFECMLNFDVVRGEDSTGVMYKAGGKLDIIKALGKPWDRLYSHKRYNSLMKTNKDVSLLIGHNRAATIGNVNVQNAHPFKCEHIYGAHNGTLRNRTNLKDHTKFEVDSENFFHHLSHHDIQDTISNCSGAYALVWYDSDDNTLNFIRNSERPLFFCFSQDMTELYWASESWMITRALKFAKAVNNNSPIQFEPMVHYKLSIPDKKSVKWVDKKFGKFRVKKLKPSTLVVQSNYYRGYYGGGYGDEYYGNNFNNLVNQQHYGGTQINPPFKRRALSGPKGHQQSYGKAIRLSDYKLGSLIAFRLTSEEIDRGQMFYYKGNVEGLSSMEVRVYQPGINLKKEFSRLSPKHPSGGGHLLVGKISKRSNGYLKVVFRTVSYKNDPAFRHLEVGADGVVKAPISNVVKFLPAPEEGSKSEEEVMYVVGSNNRLADREEAEDLIKFGCGICSNPLFLKDIVEDNLLWIEVGGDDIPVCCHDDMAEAYDLVLN